MKEKYFQYNELLKRQRDLNLLEKQGFRFLHKRNKFKLCCGIGCLIIGFITLPIPTGSVFLIGLGFFLLGLSSVDLFRFKEIGLRKIKNKLRGLK